MYVLNPHFQEKGMTKAKHDSWSHSSLKPQLFWNVDLSREVPLSKSHQLSLQCKYITLTVPFASLSKKYEAWYMVDFEFVPTLVTVKRHWVVCMLKKRSEFLHFITITHSTNKALIKKIHWVNQPYICLRKVEIDDDDDDWCSPQSRWAAQ